MKEAPLFLGRMSGTSCDGIDPAIVRMGERPELIRFGEFPMPDKLREPILRLAAPGMDEIDAMGELHRALGLAFADAALQAIAAAGLKPTDIAAIGSHGQTIRHRPAVKYPFTVQIGCASTIAEKTGITTIADFRSRDMAAGGQGAPLVPFAHRLLFGDAKHNIAVLNIGGIANLTWLGADGQTTGFDTGPGNMLMDGLILALSDGRLAYDANGELAAGGQVNDALLTRLMQHPFMNKRPPKSTGREEFGEDICDIILSCPDISDADRLATVAAFTVQSIHAAVRFLPAPPDRWLVCGGGAANSHLLSSLAKALAPADVTTTAAAGLPAEAVEAVCFAILARQTLMGEANTIAAVTGAAHPVCGGHIAPGNNWPSLLAAIPTWIR
ncbi:MAG: anhydro-N-acetylmuramic acid kinase [Mariprofundaceae bacterium]